MIRKPDADFALGFDALSRLREQAAHSPKAAVKAVAQQFEARFLEMMLKQMREAMPEGGLFDSEQTKSYVSMLDQQLAQNLSRSGVGLAAVIERQLSRTVDRPQDEASPAPADAARATNPAAPGAGGWPGDRPLGAEPAAGGVESSVPTGEAATGAESAGTAGRASTRSDAAAPDTAPHARRDDRRADFVRQMTPHAEQAASATGIPARFMVAQAALESGWGRHEPRTRDGGRSFNLFGIKAGANWKGATAAAVTTEYVGGVARRVTQTFRAYASYAEAFQDYARLIGGNPRYAAVVRSGADAAGFARGLQQAGYATDPEYAAKLGRILGRTLTA